jgi:hypothetical protein
VSLRLRETRVGKEEFAWRDKPGAPAPATGAQGYSGVWPSLHPARREPPRVVPRISFQPVRSTATCS